MSIWRARSQSHAIDYECEVIDDLTLARAEMRPALAENISDGELSLTTWFLSVTIGANHLKPQFQQRYFGLQPFIYTYIGMLFSDYYLKTATCQEAASNRLYYALTTSSYLCRKFIYFIICSIYIYMNTKYFSEVLFNLLSF